MMAWRRCCSVADSTGPARGQEAGQRSSRTVAGDVLIRVPMGFPGITVVVLLLSLGGTVPAASAQQTDGGPTAAPPVTVVAPPSGDTAPEIAVNPEALPVNISRIKRAVSRPAAIRPENTRAVFRVQVFSRSPTI